MDDLERSLRESVRAAECKVENDPWTPELQMLIEQTYIRKVLLETLYERQ